MLGGVGVFQSQLLKMGVVPHWLGYACATHCWAEQAHSTEHLLIRLEYGAGQKDACSCIQKHDIGAKTGVLRLTPYRASLVRRRFPLPAAPPACARFPSLRAVTWCVPFVPSLAPRSDARPDSTKLSWL